MNMEVAFLLIFSIFGIAVCIVNIIAIVFFKIGGAQGLKTHVWEVKHETKD